MDSGLRANGQEPRTEHDDNFQLNHSANAALSLAPLAMPQFRRRQLPPFLEGYCCQRLWISGIFRQGDPQSQCRPPRPYAISAVNSFGCSFVWVLWLAHQVRSVVAATPLTVSTASDHDSPNAPATARSVYVIAHPTARPLRRAPRSWVTAPNPHAPRATAHRPAPLHGGARSTHRGLRAGVADSFEWGFVWEGVF